MRIFISYAREDKSDVEKLIVNELNETNHQVFIDDKLKVGEEWKPQLLNAIRTSDALIYAISPDSLKSEWCQWELEQAEKVGKSIVPILLKVTSNIPDNLSKFQYVDFSRRVTDNDVKKLISNLDDIEQTHVIYKRDSNDEWFPLGENIPKDRQKIMKEEKSDSSRFFNIAGLIVGLISAIVGIIALYPIFFSPEDTPTPIIQLTPSTPIVVAQRDLDIREGPASDFERIDILIENNSLDIMGISTDRRWYQILLRDGTTGWVLAAESGAELLGNRDVLQVIIPTFTPTLTATSTTIPTQTPSDTPTPTVTLPSDTPSPTMTSLPATATSTPSNTPTPTNTSIAPSATTRPSDTPQPVGMYPCDGQIPFGTGGLLNQVRVTPSTNSPYAQAVNRGSSVRILNRVTDFGTTWYQIEYGNDNSGWITSTYINVSSNCPN